LRDIEACVAANQIKLFQMGLAQSPARSTLADALNLRDWRIYQTLALRLISRARAPYAEDSMLYIDATTYALDATIVDVCLSLFEWAPFRVRRAAIKLHTLLDLRGAIPAFLYISGGRLNEINMLDLLPIEAGSFCVTERGYLDFRRLSLCIKPVPSSLQVPGQRWTQCVSTPASRTAIAESSAISASCLKAAPRAKIS
jgi:hypothetical protein